jgi:hypothetical protein
MDASDFLHALTVAWYHQPYLPVPYPHTSEIFGELAVLRDCSGNTLATVNRITDKTILDREHLQQFDIVFS